MKNLSNQIILSKKNKRRSAPHNHRIRRRTPRAVRDVRRLSTPTPGDSLWEEVGSSEDLSNFFTISETPMQIFDDLDGFDHLPAVGEDGIIRLDPTLDNLAHFENNRILRILSIDGGGIKGIIPAMILAELEARLERPIHEIFHFLSGTSTGGIISLGLSTQKLVNGLPTNQAAFSAAKIVNLYSDEDSRGEIFQKKSILKKQKYKSEGRRDLMMGLLGSDNEYGETIYPTLSDALVPNIVSSYQFETEQPSHLFKSYLAKKHPRDNYKVHDAAWATSAAPTYFKPVKIYSCPGEEDLEFNASWHGDGGLWANNPSLSAYLEAKRLFQGQYDDIEVYSLGCGAKEKPFRGADAEKLGLFGWATRMPGIGIKTPQKQNHEYMQDFLPTIKMGRKFTYERYMRLDPCLNDEKMSKMDNIDQENIDNLQYVARNLINSKSFSAMCSQLEDEKEDFYS